MMTSAIVTERLILRKFRKEDAADLFAYLHRPRASCFLSLQLEDMAAAETEAEKRSSGEDYIAVCLKENGRLIGDLFAKVEEGGDTISVGWNFNAEFGGAGFATEAVRALFGYLFTEKKARRLYAYAEDDNLASQRLCERMGMRREALFLEFTSFEKDETGAPIYVNTMEYAILRREWEALAEG